MESESNFQASVIYPVELWKLKRLNWNLDVGNY